MVACPFPSSSFSKFSCLPWTVGRAKTSESRDGGGGSCPVLSLSPSFSLFLSFSAVHRTQDGKQRIPFTNSTANYALTSRGFTPVWMRSRGLRAPPPQGLRLNRHLVCSGCSAPPLSLAPSFPSFLPCSPRTSTSFFSICAKLAGNYAGLIYS